MIDYIEYLNIPLKVGIIVIAAFAIMHFIVKILEFKGKVVPEFLKIFNFFSHKKATEKENAEMLKEVKKLLNEVNGHYSTDNIKKRNEWMKWVNDRAVVYDETIVDITKSLDEVTHALRENTKLTEDMFVQSSRDRIIDFSYKAADDNMRISREEFNRIFKVYSKYEKFLEERGMTNGEVDVVYNIIKESYENRIKNHSFTEDIRGC